MNATARAPAQAKAHEAAEPAPVRQREVAQAARVLPDPRQAVGNLAVQSLLCPRADRPDPNSPAPIGFPHEAGIRRSLGVSAPLTGLLDPAECAARDTPAFTEGLVTRFSRRDPGLHVAAHEAAHQLQHAGITNDAGLGPEGHAGAVADAVCGGLPASGLIGRLGARVPSARRGYQLTDKEGRWKGVSPGAMIYRLSETGETLTTSSKLAYATPSLIARAAGILKGMESGIALSQGGGGISVDAPDNSACRILSVVNVDIAADPREKKFYGDCREAAKEVMGTRESGAPEQAVVTEGEEQVLVKQENPEHLVAMVIFLEQRKRDTPNYDTLSADEKRQVEKKAYEDFENLSADEKEKLKNSPVADEVAKRLGIDKYAAPRIGEAFAAFRGTKPGVDEFRFHYATVIMTAGPDMITLENMGGNPKELTKSWKIETYGPASKRQSFHDEFARSDENWHTLRIRTQPPAPSEAPRYPQMSTYELFKKFRLSVDPDERFHIEKELRKRSAQVDVRVDATEDRLGDEVFVELGGSAGPTRETSFVRMQAGTGYTFMVSLSELWPVADPLVVRVYEWDVIGNDLVGSVNWSSPYFPRSDIPMSYGDARYRVSLSMFGASFPAPAAP